MKTLVDWTAILGDRATVSFSNLAYGEAPRDEFDRSVAQLKSSEGTTIDVIWDDDEKCYVIRRFQNSIEDATIEREAHSPEEVIRDVLLALDVFSPWPTPA